MIDPHTVLRATTVALGLWGLLEALQTWVDLPNWADRSALGWDLQRMRRSRWLRSGPATALWSQRGLRRLVAIQAALACGLIVAARPADMVPLLALFTATRLLLVPRIGSDGADKIALVAASGALMQAVGLWTGEPRLALAGVLWTGGQLAIAYFSAGASKLLLARWRSGEAPQRALSSYMWGHRHAAAILRHSSLARLLAWSVMLIEALFPLALILPLPYLAAGLACVFMLHVAIAVTMGLNTYPLAFLSAYPSVLLLSQDLRHLLGVT